MQQSLSHLSWWKLVAWSTVDRRSSRGNSSTERIHQRKVDDDRQFNGELRTLFQRLREAGYIPDELPDPIQFDLRVRSATNAFLMNEFHVCQIHIDSSDESSPAHDRPRSDRTRSPPQRGSYQPLSQVRSFILSRNERQPLSDICPVDAIADVAN